MKTAIIVDIDGILFDPTARLERCKKLNNTIDWDKAFSNVEVINDPMLPNANAKLKLLSSLLSYVPLIILMTGRSDACTDATIAAMVVNDICWDTIEMRKTNDLRPDHEVKAEMIRLYSNYTFLFAVDDDYNGGLTPMYNSFGIPVYYSLDEAIYANSVFPFNATDGEK